MQKYNESDWTLVFSESIKVTKAPIKAHFAAGRYRFRVFAYNSSGERSVGDFIEFTVASAPAPAPGELTITTEYNDRIYAIFQKSCDWLEARAIAKESGGALVSIPDAATQAAVAAAVKTYNMPVWVGGNAADHGLWGWENGEYFYASYQYTNWGSDPASYAVGINNYVVMTPDGKWHDTNNGGYNHQRVTAYMVEFEPTSLTVKPKQVGYRTGTYLTRDDLIVTATFGDGYQCQLSSFGVGQSGSTAGAQQVFASFANLSATEAVTFYDAMPTADFALPENLTAIGEEAFAGLAMTAVRCPDGLQTISARAFADCANLRHIYIPEDVVIDDTAFDGCSGDLILWGAEGGSVQAFAEAHGLGFIAE